MKFNILLAACLFCIQLPAQSIHFLHCPSARLMLKDTTANDPGFWKASYWTDADSGLHNLAETPVDLNITLTDSCGTASIDALLFLDLDGDGIQETAVQPASVNQTPGAIRYNNAFNLNFSGGELRDFDNRVVSALEKYKFALQLVRNGDTTQAFLRLNTLADTGNYLLPQLPPGTHKIVWLVQDSCGHPDTCLYLFTIVGDHPSGGFTGIAIRFPNDTLFNPCIGPFPFNLPGPQIYNPGNLPLIIKEEWMDYQLPIPDACFKLDHIWTIINPDTYDPTLPLISIPNPRPSALVTNPLNFPGPIVAAAASPAPWAPTVVKAYPTDTIPTNYSIYWNIHANGFRYDQYVKIQDLIPPVIYNCPAQSLTLTDSTSNDSTLWNASYWLNHHTAGHDLSETPVDLSLHAYDACSGINIAVSCWLFLDLDQDGEPESVVYMNNLPAPGMVRYGNINNPGYDGGELRKFDQRAVPDTSLYRFGMVETITDTERICHLVWFPSSLHNINPVLPQLPPGHHKVKWQVYDGCGNDRICTYDLIIPFDSLLSVQDAGPAGYFGMIQCTPNPFHDRVLIFFEMPEADATQIRVFDAMGRVLWQQEQAFSAGRQSVQVQLPGDSGVLYVEVQSSKGLAVQKMVRMK
jgi:hypothetical protein